jgi:hypothetical protein
MIMRVGNSESLLQHVLCIFVEILTSTKNKMVVIAISSLATSTSSHLDVKSETEPHKRQHTCRVRHLRIVLARLTSLWCNRWSFPVFPSLHLGASGLRIGVRVARVGGSGVEKMKFKL